MKMDRNIEMRDFPLDLRAAALTRATRSLERLNISPELKRLMSATMSSSLSVSIQ
jgi:hypothetical protein